MTIVYALVSRQKTVLAEYTTTSGESDHSRSLLSNAIFLHFFSLDPTGVLLPKISVILIVLTFTWHLHCAVTGNFPTVTRVLLAKIPPSDGRMIYNYDDYVVSEGVVCVA